MHWASLRAGQHGGHTGPRHHCRHHVQSKLHGQRHYVWSSGGEAVFVKRSVAARDRAASHLINRGPGSPLLLLHLCELERGIFLKKGQELPRSQYSSVALGHLCKGHENTPSAVPAPSQTPNSPNCSHIHVFLQVFFLPRKIRVRKKQCWVPTFPPGSQSQLVPRSLVAVSFVSNAVAGFQISPDVIHIFFFLSL